MTSEPEATRLIRIAIDHVEEAEMMLRGRLRATLGVGGTDFAALRYVRRCEDLEIPARPGGLRRWLSVSSAAATAITDRLCTHGLLEKHADLDDGRSRTLVLSPEGRRRMNEAMGPSQERIEAVFAQLSPEDAAKTIALLDSLAEAIAEPVIAEGTAESTTAGH